MMECGSLKSRGSPHHLHRGRRCNSVVCCKIIYCTVEVIGAARAHADAGIEAGVKVVVVVVVVVVVIVVVGRFRKKLWSR